MRSKLLEALDGKAPLLCLKELQAALYVISTSVIKDGLDVDVVVNTLNGLHDHMIKTLMDGKLNE
jgi:small ligand-binding sensory domain FIST